MTSIAIYVLVLSGALADNKPGLCRDRINLAIQSAPAFVSERMTRKQAFEAAKRIANEQCNG
jgi:hypothetical protein